MFCCPMLLQVVRMKEVDIAQMNKNMASVQGQLERTGQELNAAKASLRVSPLFVALF